MSRPASTPSRTRRAALVLAAVLALGACTQGRDVPEDYGTGLEEDFVAGCEEALTDSDGEGEALSDEEAAEVCGCTYDRLADREDGIPIEELKELNDAQEEEPVPLQDPIRERIDACTADAGLS